MTKPRVRYRGRMANPEQLEIIKQGAQAWNKWRETVNPPQIDLTNEELSALHVSGANFREAYFVLSTLDRSQFHGADFTRACLIDASAENANFSRAKLIDCRLRGARLRSAHLNDADLSHSDLTNVDLHGGDLRRANVTEAQIGFTLFGNALLDGVIGLDTVVHAGPSTIGIETVYRDNLPDEFLRGCGVPDDIISYLPSLRSKPLEFYSCFISYSHADKVFARRLYAVLQSRGVRCWLDEKEMLPGDDIYQHIDRGIRLWDKFLLCCSQHSLKPPHGSIKRS